MATDLSGLTDEDLEQQLLAIRQERERRRVIAEAPARVEEIAQAYQRAIGRETGAEWAQPTGAHDAYSEGAVVTHAGKTWRSEIPANVWEPGVHGWEPVDPGDEDAEPLPQPEADPWAVDTDYDTGDLAEFEGVVYESIQAHRSQDGWTPPAVPALWRVY